MSEVMRKAYEKRMQRCGYGPGQFKVNAEGRYTDPDVFGYFGVWEAAWQASHSSQLSEKEQRISELGAALIASQRALIGVTQELGVIEAQMPGGLPYGIKSVKIPVDIQISLNAATLSPNLGEPKETPKDDV